MTNNDTPRAVTDLARNAAETYFGTRVLAELTDAQRDHAFEVAWETYNSQNGR
jgi:hypothetical protein